MTKTVGAMVTTMITMIVNILTDDGDACFQFTQVLCRSNHTCTGHI